MTSQQMSRLSLEWLDVDVFKTVPGEVVFTLVVPGDEGDVVFALAEVDVASVVLAD